MARVTATAALGRRIESLFDSGSLVGLSNRQLLERFNAGRDDAAEAAFSALVARHGPMVSRICIQLLHDRQHAEDAFQAVFLVLARRARSVRDPEKLANWLYGVAVRTARCARPGIERQLKREGKDFTHPSTAMVMSESRFAVSPEQAALDRERAEVLHDEIERLPRSFRLPIVLCYFEGLSVDEAASRLAVARGTIGSRLTRARERLRRGLTRRGFTLSSAGVLGLLGSRDASAHVSALLCDTTARAGVQFLAGKAAGVGLSTAAVATAGIVIRGMAWSAIRMTVVGLLALVMVASGVGYTAIGILHDVHAREGEARAEPAPAAAAGRMIVSGRVLDPEGKPVKGAVVDLVGSRKLVEAAASVVDDRLRLLGQAQTDGEGRIRIDASKVSSNTHYSLFALATAPGYGLGWIYFNLDADQPSGDIQLFPEQAVRIRLLDIRGLPAAGVEVSVLRMSRRIDEKKGYDTVSISSQAPTGLRCWARSVKTDAQGRASLPGIGSDLIAFINVNDPRYAQQTLDMPPARLQDGKEVSLVLQPARTIEGRVLAADTGKPIPRSVVVIASRGGRPSGGIVMSKFQADDQGRFTANPYPGESFNLSAYAPDGEPYPVSDVEFSWPKGAVKKSIDIPLPRGVSLRGKVIERGSGRGLAGASIANGPGRNIFASKQDGSFECAVPPGKGTLFIFGPTSDYVLEEIGSRRLRSNSRPGGVRYYSHAIIPYDTKAGDAPKEIVAELRPGTSIKGRVEGPHGETVSDAALITTLHVEPRTPTWRGKFQPQVRDGRFELHGIDPSGSTRIHILEPEHEWGTTVELSGKPSHKEVTVRFEPCGRANARYVGPDGKPLAKFAFTSSLSLVVTPGPNQFDKARDQDELVANEAFISNFDPKHYWNEVYTNADGRATLVALIPGAVYRINDMSTLNVPQKGVQVRKEFRVKSGETVELGDIVIEKPKP